MTQIVRNKIESFLENNKTNNMILNIGAGNRKLDRYFKKQIRIDFIKTESIDILCDAHNLCFKNNLFQNVLISEVLEHLSCPQKSIDDINRIMKKDGKLLLTTVFMYPYHPSPKDYFRYTEDGLRYLLNEWSNVDIMPYANRFEFIGNLIQCYGDNDLKIPGLRFMSKIIGRIISFFPSKNYRYTVGYHVIAKK